MFKNISRDRKTEQKIRLITQTKKDTELNCDMKMNNFSNLCSRQFLFINNTSI